MFKTPIVLIVFNRPNETRKVLKKIVEVNPKNVYVIADGPRDKFEITKTNEVRNIIDEELSQFNIIKNYSEKNLGTKKRIVSGLNWVFGQENEAIILEDDCLPDNSFFVYAENLLKHYEDDKRIMTISGNNFFDAKKSYNKHSYYFSLNHHIWGWATWKRAWSLYDENLKNWKEFIKENLLFNLFGNKYEAKIWFDIINASYNHPEYTWDHQWIYTCLQNSGLCITPKVNLVENIGFTSNATRTKDKKSPFSELKTGTLEFPLVHPTYIVRDRKLDLLESKYLKQSLFKKIINKLID